MIVAPVPTSPRSPRRRALRAAAILLPAVLLAAIVGAGALGPRPAAPSTPHGAIGATPEPSAARLPSAGGGTTPQPTGPRTVEIAPAEPFPREVASLPVRTVSSTLAAFHAGGSPVVAVAGYLLAWPDDGTCLPNAAGLPGGACDRVSVLGETTWSKYGGGGFAGIGPHLHARIPPGIELPAGAEIPAPAPGAIPAPEDGASPIPVVVIGRFGDSPPGCNEELNGCVDPFTIERFAWASGSAITLAPAAEAGLTPDAADPVVAALQQTTSAALGPNTALLQVVLLRPGSLVAVDPAAAAAIGEGRSRPVWYVRGLDVSGDPLPDPAHPQGPAQIRWAVLDPGSGAVIAAGSLSVVRLVARRQSAV